MVTQNQAVEGNRDSRSQGSRRRKQGSKENRGVRRIRGGKAVLNSFRRGGGQCPGRADVAPDAGVRAVPCSFRFDRKEKRQKAKAKCEKSTPDGQGSRAQS